MSISDKKFSPKILIVLLFQLCILTFSVFVITNNLSIFYDEGEGSFIQKESVNSAYVTHAPILILSDADFAPFPGAGTPGDPKIIENYEIITDSNSLLYIRDTTLHFIIRNNHFKYTTAYDMDGIGLHNVKNGVIENNLIEHAQHGIFLIDSENVSIYNNQIDNSYASGIRLLTIDGKVNVTYNTIDNVGYHGNGIWLDQHCQQLIIEHNTVFNIPFGNGIFIDGRNWTTPVDPYPIPPPPAPNYQREHDISHNEIYDCENGIMFFVANNTLEYEFSGNSIFDNYLHDNSQDGFCTNHHFQIEFYNNILSNNGLRGAYFDDGLHNTQIINNTFTDNEYGISINSIDYNIQHNDFINNTFLSNDYGLSFEGAAIMNLISNNRIENGDDSLDFHNYAGQNNITFNTIRENTNGILFHSDGTENNVSKNNIISSSLYGLYFESDTSNCSIHWNTFIGNNEGLGTQVYDNGTLNQIIYNYYDDWTEPDDNSDGYVDFPYIIDGEVGNSDPYPLADPATIVDEHYLTQVYLLSPNGGEMINDSTLIRWTKTFDSWFFIVTYSVSYSSNGGVDWVLIASELDNTSYLWNTVNVPKSSTYLIRVNATSKGNLENYDESNGYFTLQPHTITPPTILAPNGGEVVNDSTLISWTESIDSWDYDLSYSIEISSDGGTIWQELVSGLEETSYLWDTVNVPKGTYLVRINASSEDGLISSDESDGFFTLQEHTLSLPTVLTPNGGELINDSILISWTKSFDSWGYDISYSVEVSSNGGSSWTEIAFGLNETSYLWNTVNALKSSTYLIRINATSEDGLISTEESDATFTLQAHTLSIPTIMYPSGGETLVGVIPINWEECIDSWCCSISYSVYYSADNGVNWVQLATGLTQLSYSWNTESVDDGDEYVVKVTSNGGYNMQQEFVSGVFSIDNVKNGKNGPDPLILSLIIGGIVGGVVVAGGGTYYVMRRRSTKRVPPEN